MGPAFTALFGDDMHRNGGSNRSPPLSYARGARPHRRRDRLGTHPRSEWGRAQSRRNGRQPEL